MKHARYQDYLQYPCHLLWAEAGREHPIETRECGDPAASSPGQTARVSLSEVHFAVGILVRRVCLLFGDVIFQRNDLQRVSLGPFRFTLFPESYLIVRLTSFNRHQGQDPFIIAFKALIEPTVSCVSRHYDNNVIDCLPLVRKLHYRASNGASLPKVSLRHSSQGLLGPAVANR